MKIHSLSLLDKGTSKQIQSIVEYAGTTKKIWYSVSQEYCQYLVTETFDAFLVGTLYIAMQYGEDIYIEGYISEKLLYNLNNYYINILTLVNPELRPIQVVPTDTVAADFFDTENKVATGFSGGIDSFCVLSDHFYNDISENYKISFLIFNNVGSHGPRAEELFHLRSKALSKFAESNHLSLIKINSNLADLLGGTGSDFVLNHTLRNISAVLNLQKLFGKFIYASGYRYQDCYIGRAKALAYADPYSVHLLSTNQTEMISSGCQYSRTEKTAKVSLLETSYQYLDVCVTPVTTGKNCSRCPKCARTILTLKILKRASLYEKVFNLSTYQRWAGFYEACVLNSQDEFSREIIELAQREGYSFRAYSKVLAMCLKSTPIQPIRFYSFIIYRIFPAFHKRLDLLKNKVNAVLFK